MLRRAVVYKFADVSEVCALMMEGGRISETPVNYYQTSCRNIQKTIHLKYNEWIGFVFVYLTTCCQFHCSVNL